MSLPASLGCPVGDAREGDNLGQSLLFLRGMSRTLPVDLHYAVSDLNLDCLVVLPSTALGLHGTFLFQQQKSDNPGSIRSYFPIPRRSCTTSEALL